MASAERQNMLLFLSLFCGSIIFLVCICEVSPPKKPHSFLANFIVRIPQFIAHLIDVLASPLVAIHLLLQIIWIYPAQTAMSLALLIAFSFQIDWYPVNAIVQKTREAVLFIFRLKLNIRCVMPRLNNSGVNLCVVCITREKSVVLLPCRHLCMCTCCYDNVMARLSRACPVCRAYVKSNIVVYT